MNEDNKIGYYAVIPASVLFNENLKSNEKLLYAIITVLANKEGYCYASNNYLADLLNAQSHTVSKWVSHLKELGFVCLDIIKSDKGEIIQRRIYPNDIPYSINRTYPYAIKKTYPYTINGTEGMSQKGQYNNININKIDRFFNYFIKREFSKITDMTKEEIRKFSDILEEKEFNYTEELLEIFTSENVKKVKICTYALKELFKSSKKNLIAKATREDILFFYDRCMERKVEYEGTENEISNFYEYYYISLINGLEKAK